MLSPGEAFIISLLMALVTSAAPQIEEVAERAGHRVGKFLNAWLRK